MTTMTRSPYDILGVSPNASADEVKRAYRKKARENHPDLNPNDPGAAARMNEINEAYDRITNPEKYAKETAYQHQQQGGSSRPGGQQTTGQGGNAYGPQGDGTFVWVNGFGFDLDDLFGDAVGTGPIHPEVSASDSAEFRMAIDSINAGHYREATQILNTVTSAGRSARWYYLSAIANHGAGNTVLALDQIRRATTMDPGNTDYKRAQRRMSNRAQTYQQETQAQGFSLGAMSPMLLCCGCLAISSMMRPFCYGFYI